MSSVRFPYPILFNFLAFATVTDYHHDEMRSFCEGQRHPFTIRKHLKGASGCLLGRIKMRKALHFLAHLLGFEKLSQYERDYLHRSNLQGCIYVGFLAVALEIWMLVRQTIVRIIPKCLDGMDFITALLKYTTKFWLLLLAGLVLAFVPDCA